jgi:hypothetical protein
MNTGHGHVIPREDGIVARCGGPTLCVVCAFDFAQRFAPVAAAEPRCDHCGRPKAEHLEAVGWLVCPLSIYKPVTD